VQQPQSPPPTQPQQQTQQMRYFSITPDLILKNQISSIDQLAEPYLLIHSKRQNAGAIVHAANILARHPKGYRIHSFTMSRFYAYMIMEKGQGGGRKVSTNLSDVE
jgi:hypothetical protein